MSNFNRRLNAGLLVAFTATVATVARPQPASAQLLEVVGGAINALVRSKQPQPQVVQQRVPVPVPAGPELSLGTNNANGNNLNLCISNCLPPGSHPAPALQMPQPVAPQVIQQPRVIQQPQIVRQAPVPQQHSSTVVRQNSDVPGAGVVQTNQQSSQSAIVQNTPN